MTDSERGVEPARMRNQELVERVQAQLPGAFEEFYYAYVDRVHRHLFSIVGPDSDLDDLVQQTFVLVHQRIHTFRGESSVSTWLHRVTVNVALDHLRRRRRWFRLDSVRDMLPMPSEPEQPDAMADRGQQIRVLHQVLDRLKPKKRLVFVMYEIEGHTLEEIAEVVDSSVNTVAARLRAARQEVRQAMERRLKQVPLKAVG
ncbi:MAG: RNA polymerase sigma factor [Pseudomonadota bacterium]